MVQFDKWMRRAIVVLVVLNLSSLYSNWRLVQSLRAPLPHVEEISHAAESALQAE